MPLPICQPYPNRGRNQDHGRTELNILLKGKELRATLVSPILLWNMSEESDRRQLGTSQLGRAKASHEDRKHKHSVLHIGLGLLHVVWSPLPWSSRTGKACWGAKARPLEAPGCRGPAAATQS
jgi:hypothetical protein